MADDRIVAAAPLMLAALEAYMAASDHSDVDDCGCDGDCAAAIDLWHAFDRLARVALVAVHGAREEGQGDE